MDQFPKQLDKLYLKNYYKNLVNEVREIFEIFLEETEPALSKIKSLIVIQKFEEASEEIHTISPSFNLVGLTELNISISELEILCKEKNSEKSLAAIDFIIQGYYSYLPALVEEYERLKEFKK